MRPGDKVLAKVHGGKTVRRVLVDVIENTAVICTPAEWESAIEEKRKPDCVGFPIRDVRPINRTESTRA